MSAIVTVFWNALLTAFVVMMLVGLFLAAMPRVYVATATVRGEDDGMLTLRSAELLDKVVAETEADLNDLEGWLEQITSANLSPLHLLQKNVSVSEGEKDGWINISVQTHDAIAASTLANDIARTYITQRARASLTPSEKLRLISEVERVNTAILELVQANPRLVNPVAEKQRLSWALERLNRQQMALNKQIVAQDELKILAETGEAGGLNEPGVARAVQRLDSLKVRQSELAVRYGSLHQNMAAIVSEIDKAGELLELELKAYIKRLESSQKALRAESERMQKEIEALVLERDQFELLELEYHRLEMERELTLKRYEGMVENEFYEDFAQAIPPRHGFGSQQLIVLGSSFVATFLLMILLMFARLPGRTA